MSAEPARRLLGRLLASVVLACGVAERCAATTLYESIGLAYQTNPTLRAQRAELRATDEGFVQAKTGFGPQISITAQVDYQRARIDQPGFVGSTDYRARTATADLSVTQPIFSSGALSAQVRGAGHAILAGREMLRQAESQLILNVITAYVDVRRDRETIAVLRDEIDSLNRIFDETKAKGKLGQLTKTDVAQSESRLLSTQAQLNLAVGQLMASNAEYLAFVGENPGDLVSEPDLRGLPASVDEAFDTAIANNPQLLQATQNQLVQQEKVNQARAARGPTISARIDGLIGPVEPYLQDGYNRSVTGALVLSQPIFTSGLNQSRVREAADRDREAILNVEAARRAVIQQVAQAWSRLVSTRSATKIESKQVEVETTAVIGNRVEERVGQRTTIELLNAELELANSRVLLVENRHDEYVARAELLFAMGLLQVQFLIPNADLYDPSSALRRIENVGSVPWRGVVARVDGLASSGYSSPSPSPAGSGLERPLAMPPLPAEH